MAPGGALWSVRPASAIDADALALIGAATFLETFAGVLDGRGVVRHCAVQHAPAFYRERLAAPAFAAWLAEAAVGGAPIGYALIGPPDLAAADARDLELKRFYVFSRFHGGGPPPPCWRPSSPTPSRRARLACCWGPTPGTTGRSRSTARTASSPSASAASPSATRSTTTSFSP